MRTISAKRYILVIGLAMVAFFIGYCTDADAANIIDNPSIQAANDNGNGGGCVGYQRSWPIGGGFTYVETAYCDGSGNLVIVSSIVRSGYNFLTNWNPANEENGGGQYVKLCYVWHGDHWALTPWCP